MHGLSAVTSHDVRALGAEGFGEGAAQAAGGTGDQRNPPVQSSGHEFSIASEPRRACPQSEARVRRGDPGNRASSSVLRVHGHDHGDSIDDALESSKEGIRTLVISFSVLMAVAVAQVFVVYITGSIALLADTIHNFADASTAIPLFIAFRLGRRPPHPPVHLRLQQS